ncbi:hypothetical protein JB92DRAFT_3118098 [Gautieria morchelliformis]|nr:hypothetical protein JB92DRAFT_3118098 [Gautieria morchelliformis]
MVLGGPNQVLSDITPAAGWQVMGCDPNWSSGSHDIRMVCTGTPAQMTQCNHLYDNGGAEETVVRLPQNCGTGPFARVQKTYVPTDQSSPYNLTRRDGNPTAPAVKGLTLDYDFASIPTSRGNLTLAIASTNVGGKPFTRRDMDNLRKRGRGRLLAQRGLFDSFTSVIGGIVSDATSVFDHATSVIASATSFNKTDDTGVVPISVANNFTLIDTTITCAQGSGTASLHIDVDTDLTAQVQFGYTIAGSIIPPKIEDVAVVGCKYFIPRPGVNDSLLDPSRSALSGDASATFNIQAQAQGTFDTGVLQLFKSGLPGLSIPGIVTLGPEFSIGTELQMANLELEADMSLTTDFSLPNLQLVFPQDKGKSTGAAQPKNGSNALKLSAGPSSASVSGTITAHVIPRMDFGIDFVDGLAQASVFMNVDISGAVDLQLTAGSSATANNTSQATTSSTGGNATIPNATNSSTTADNTSSQSPQPNRNTTIPDGPVPGNGNTSFTDTTSINGSSPLNSSSSSEGSSNAAATQATASGQLARATPAPVKRSIIQRANTVKGKRAAESVNGCVQVTGSIAVNGGLEGTLTPLFSKSISFPIFQTSVPLLQKCFGNGNKSRGLSLRSIAGGSHAARAYRYARLAKAAAPKAASSGSTKNDIKPQKSTGDKSKLACSPFLTPLSALLAII